MKKAAAHSSTNINFFGISYFIILLKLFALHLGLEIWRTEMLEKIKVQLIQLVLNAIQIDRKGDTAVPTRIVNGVILSLVAVEDPKRRIPGDPSSQLSVRRMWTIL